MKLNTLQIGKAMSAALFVLLLSVAGMKNALAQTQVATLQHGDSMSAFYGMNALVEAHTAATDGDIITLSSGVFTSPTYITKAITLHGAGCSADTLGITPTIVAGWTVLNVPNDSIYLTVEGISFQDEIDYFQRLHYAKFIKCEMASFKRGQTTSNAGYLVRDVQFINCLIKGTIEPFSENNSVSFVNCAIASLRHADYWWSGANYNNYHSTHINLNNSIIGQFLSTGANANNMPGNLNLTNCIVGENANHEQIINSYAYNCIVVDSAFSCSVQAFNCMFVDSFSDVFESFDGSFSNTSDYHLKEEVANTFLGTDGREVGIYGGAMPYNSRPSYLILNRCNVAGQSTIDGKLSVEIEVISNGGN